MHRKAKLTGCAALAIAAVLASEPVMAQAAAEDTSGEILVTARKRDETSIAVPVVLTAVSGADLERRAIVKIDDLTSVVPQLQVGNGGSNVLGGIVAIRGIAGSEGNPFGDQAVSFNVDGVQVSKVLIRRMAEMDLGQVEVLKGPQALFFGKNSPAGIISMRSADPTNKFEAKLSTGYEFNAREWRADGFVSGPITDTLSARLAAFGTTMRGWFDNTVDDSNVYRSSPHHAPKTKEYAVRGTLKWEPTDQFSARLKVSYNKLKDSGPLATSERGFCPLGTPQLGGGPDDCKLNGRAPHLDVGPFLSTISDRYPEDGESFIRQKQALVSHEMNYDFSDVLSLTSVTGYYYVSQRLADLFNAAWDPALALPSANEFGSKEFSQELRLASSYDGPVNFLAGGYFQKTNTYSGNTTFTGLEPVNGVNPAQLNDYYLRQKGTGYSWFAQVMVKPVEQVEISAGGRYSYERKRLTRIETQPGGVGPGPIPRTVLPEDPRFPRKDSWTNFSPEITVTYRPTSDLTVFGNYKHGFLSGGFNGGATNFSSDLRFDQQKIKGYEGGVKARLFDGALRTNLALYRYVITGLQITTSATLANNVPSLVVTNAGKVTVKGADFDFTYRTPLEGLTIHGAVGYNKGVYNTFSGTCYRGQTQEAGCNIGVPTTAVIGGQTFTSYNLQDQSGDRLYRAPRWSGNIGAGYEGKIGSSLRFGLNAEMYFSSNYDTNVSAPPTSIQKSYQQFSASGQIGAQNDSWEVALIGKNLTDKYFQLRTADTPLSGTVPGRAANDPRGSILSDPYGAVNRGREIMLRLTLRYGR